MMVMIKAKHSQVSSLFFDVVHVEFRVRYRLYI